MRGALVVVALCLSSSFALAQGEQAEVTEYRFEDALVETDMAHPRGEIFTIRERSRRSSLIRPRQGFVPEMLKAAEAR